MLNVSDFLFCVFTGDETLDNIPTTLSPAQSSARCRQHFKNRESLASENGEPSPQKVVALEKAAKRSREFRKREVFPYLMLCGSVAHKHACY